MGLFRKNHTTTVCKDCNLECYSIDKLDKHRAIAHVSHDTTRESRRALAKSRGQFS